VSRALASAFLVLALLIGTVAPVVATPDKAADAPGGRPGSIVPGEVIVKWRDEGTVAAANASARGLRIVTTLDAAGTAGATLVSTGGRPVEHVVSELEADPSVEYAEPNYVVGLPEADAGGVAAEGVVAEGAITGIAVNDPQTSGQYSLDRMRVRDAWSLTKGAANAIAVLDTGVQASHPDLSGRVLAGYNFVADTTNATDDNGHGTWVAGIIAANTNNAYGVAGISWTDKILPVKIMNSDGLGNTADLAAGIRWAADRGAKVINMSVGGFPYSLAVQDAAHYAWAKGAVLVGAAGNNNRAEAFYPASYDNVVSVSATQVNDEFSHWSSYGPKVDVSAPGSSVLTTNCTVSPCVYATNGPSIYISGTSFATPNVAGVVALLRARFPADTPAQIVTRLLASVDDLGYPGRDDRYGLGRVNAYRALGGSATRLAHGRGDGLEGNNTLSSAKVIPLGLRTRPTLYPAGDTDWFAVDVPRAGRLDVRVGGVSDTRPYPWHKSSLPVDPIVELYTTSGTLLRRIDAQWESGVELASTSVGARARILVRVLNYYANGSTSPYWVEPTFVDTVAPTVTSRLPGSGSVNTSRFPTVVAGFSEPVANVTSTTLRLRDTTTGSLVPASVSYDATRREGRLAAVGKLSAERRYQVEVTSGIRDQAGNALTPASWSFTTGISGFADTVGSPFEYDIAWMAEAKITSGCGIDRFCPRANVTREQMASFLVRGFRIAQSSVDAFGDDAASAHQADINALAASAITGGCAAGRFCPSRTVTREQMASFLVRALDLPSTTRDYFADDNGSPHESDINRLASAGITGGCNAGAFCPGAAITREQMAAFLRRALDR
jgi:type VII secretion-associated serine protease mycosin